MGVGWIQHLLRFHFGIFGARFRNFVLLLQVSKIWPYHPSKAKVAAMDSNPLIGQLEREHVCGFFHWAVRDTIHIFNTSFCNRNIFPKAALVTQSGSNPIFIVFFL